MATALKPQNGIVAFFDVLGYQSIIDNNKIEDAAEVISRTLLTLPKSVGKVLGSFLKTEPALEISWLIISDTVILAAPFEQGADPLSRLRTWFRLLMHSAYLMRHTFDGGLPMRGVIDTGEFYIEDHSFAGKPIIRAFRETHELEVAACMLTIEAEESLYSTVAEMSDREKAAGIEASLSQIVFPYLVPLKKENTRRRAIVNWVKPVTDFPAPPTDPRQYAFEAFHAFSKDVPNYVVPKLENTERLLRYSIGKLWQRKSTKTTPLKPKSTSEKPL